MGTIATKSNPLSELTSRVDDLEKALLAQPQVSCPVTHSFAPGLYIRELRAPAGAAIIGHHQNFEHLNIFIQGRVMMLNEATGETYELCAPMTFVAPPGRKVGYIVEDMIWQNVYSTNETDVEKLEEHYLTKGENWQQLQATKPGQIEHKPVPTDLVPLPYGSYKIKRAPEGLVATSDISLGEVLAPLESNGRPTIATLTNESDTPNAEIIKLEGFSYLVALKPISGCHGGQNGELITVRKNQECQPQLPQP